MLFKKRRWGPSVNWPMTWRLPGYEYTDLKRRSWWITWLFTQNAQMLTLFIVTSYELYWGTNWSITLFLDCIPKFGFPFFSSFFCLFFFNTYLFRTFTHFILYQNNFLYTIYLLVWPQLTKNQFAPRRNECFNQSAWRTFLQFRNKSRANWLGKIGNCFGQVDWTAKRVINYLNETRKRGWAKDIRARMK